MSDTPPPLPFVWDGESLVPKLPRIADRHYVIGETYRMAPMEDVSTQSRGHYFAALKEAWQNLPEDQAERFPDPETLRKYALIRTGFRDERSLVCSSKAEAERVAGFIKARDQYAVVVVKAATITEYTAKSQSARAMGKEEFQRSKQAVLDYVATLIGVDSKTLEANAGQAA
jgi:hypothetical protein